MSTGAGLLSKTLRTTETLSLHVKATFRQLSLGNQTWWHWWCRAIWECTLLTPFLQIADFLQTAAHFLLSHQTQFPTSVLLTYFCLYVFYFFLLDPKKTRIFVHAAYHEPFPNIVLFERLIKIWMANKSNVVFCHCPKVPIRQRERLEQTQFKH